MSCDQTSEPPAGDTCLRREAIGVAVLNSLSAHVAVLDHRGTILAVNDAWLRFAQANGGAPDQVHVGVNYLDACRPTGHPADDEVAAAALDGIQSVLNGARPSFTLEYPCDGPSNPRWFLLTVLPLSGPQRGVVIAHEDITRRKALEEQLRQTHKLEAIGTLAGGIAHDFNNLLTVIQGFTVQALAVPGVPPEASEALQHAAAAAHRAATLTRQLLTFSRRQPVRLQPLDLNNAIASLFSMLRRIVREDIELEFLHEDTPLWLHADPGMIDQVLLNLVVNARDAMPAGGRLSVRTAIARIDASCSPGSPRSRFGDFVQLSVTDTGTGIPAQHLKDIFNPFFTTKNIGEGTGLGLATVHTIVEQHQGWIEVTSEVGQGTTFQVLLPVAASPRLQTDPQTAPASHPLRHGRGQCILLVEDNAPLSLLASRVLQRHGYRVLKAETGDAALQLWAKHEPEIELLLTDIILRGGLDGGELARRLRKARPNLRVVFCSGYDGELCGRTLPEKDAPRILVKPFSPDALLRAVDHGLNSAL